MLEYTNASQCLACHSHEEGTTKDESYNEDALQDILEEENITGQAETLQQLKWSNLLISRTQLKLM